MCFKGLFDEAMFPEELLYEECVFWMFCKKLCMYTGHLQTCNFICRKAYCYTILSACCYIKHREPAPDWFRLYALIVDW